MKTPEEFFGKQALKRYKYAVSIAEKIIDLQNKGYIIFNKTLEDGELIDGKFFINTKFNHDSWSVVSFKSDNVEYVLVGIEYLDNSSPWLPPIKEIKKIFKGFTCIHPKDVISII